MIKGALNGDEMRAQAQRELQLQQRKQEADGFKD